jgi:uncharacterized protein YndB with AHSA1/START domain
MMADIPNSGRIDSASRVIRGSSRTLYAAFLDPEALVKWLPPAGMTGKIYKFEPRAGGVCRMALTYNEPWRSVAGKTTEDTDVFDCYFRELVPDERIVQIVRFQSDDPAYSGEMTMTWDLSSTPDGTRVTITCENVPYGIRKEDHDTGLRSTLDNLAEFVEATEARTKIA